MLEPGGIHKCLPAFFLLFFLSTSSLPSTFPLFLPSFSFLLSTQPFIYPAVYPSSHPSIPNSLHHSSCVCSYMKHLVADSWVSGTELTQILSLSSGIIDNKAKRGIKTLRFSKASCPTHGSPLSLLKVHNGTPQPRPTESQSAF